MSDWSSAVALGCLALVAGTAYGGGSPESRQAEVRERSAVEMPFDMAATTHVFTKMERGGTQRVVAKARDDVNQVALIRAHLRDLANRFRRRDFGGPGHVHGAGMPGLDRLRTAAPGALQIDYHDLPSGGEIDYRSDRADVIAALHAWFDAQVADHGSDATMGHEHAMHPHS